MRLSQKGTAMRTPPTPTLSVAALHGRSRALHAAVLAATLVAACFASTLCAAPAYAAGETAGASGVETPSAEAVVGLLPEAAPTGADAQGVGSDSSDAGSGDRPAALSGESLIGEEFSSYGIVYRVTAYDPESGARAVEAAGIDASEELHFLTSMVRATFAATTAPAIRTCCASPWKAWPPGRFPGSRRMLRSRWTRRRRACSTPYALPRRAFRPMPSCSSE